MELNFENENATLRLVTDGATVVATITDNADGTAQVYTLNQNECLQLATFFIEASEITRRPFVADTVAPDPIQS